MISWVDGENRGVSTRSDAARQIAHIGAVLIHQRQPLDAVLRRSALIDKHHAAVEIAFLAGQALIDLVGDDMRDPPPVFRRGEILLAGELLAGGDVPQAELRLEAPVALPRHAAGHQRLRVDGLPVGELRRDVDVGDVLDIGGLIDRREQPAALEVVGDDLGDADADLAIRRRSRHEIRNCDRQRREVALGITIRFGRLARRRGVRRCRQRAKRGHSGNDLPAAQAERHPAQSILVDHVIQALHFTFSTTALWPLSGLSFGKYRREKFPLVEKGRRQIVGLALDDRAQRALLIDAQIWRRGRGLRHRRAFQRTVPLQLDLKCDFRIF